MAGRRFLPACVLPLLGACNMVISELPMFAEADVADLKPKQGIWLAEDPECRFDSALPAAEWPECAMWLIVEGPGQISLEDGKGQSQEARYVIAKGQPLVVQILWRDDAKEERKSFYVFFGLEPRAIEAGDSFASASTWAVACGVQDPASRQVSPDIKPYPGISPECRPFSQDAVRSAALASRPTAEMPMSWRWLRPAGR